MSSNNRPLFPESARMRRLTPILASVAFAALAACADHSPADKGPQPLTPTERYPIAVRPAPEELKLAAHAGGLSGNQIDALRDFVREWRDVDGGVVTLKTPMHGPDPAATYRTATGARDFLVSQGVESDKVRIVGYEAQGDAQAPVSVGFVRYIAKGPDCGQSWSDLSRVDNNREYPEFGCSMAANIAAQIANPADLLQPRDQDPADAQRREAVIGKYRDGQVTSTAKDTQADAILSSVGH